MTTEQNTAEKPSQKRSPRKKRRPAGKKQPQYDHVPIIIFLLIIFSFALLCIGLALTPFLAPDAPKVPAAGSLKRNRAAELQPFAGCRKESLAAWRNMGANSF
ncbi:MAG: hypothetical protein ACL93V_03795 [Candidatus Electrothrix sp. YB6]